MVAVERRRVRSAALAGAPIDQEADLLFLTQDTEFADLPADTAATVMSSRVPQFIPIARRVDLWLHAVDDFLQHPRPGRLFEVFPDGRVVGWEIRDT